VVISNGLDGEARRRAGTVSPPPGPHEEAAPAPERADPEAALDAAGEAWILMRDLYISQRPWLNAITSELGLGPADALALHRLDPRRPVNMGELAHDLSYDSSHITGIVDRLEERGYVERRPSARDRRAKLVCVTADGERVRRRLIARMAEAPPSLARLCEADQVALRDVLRRALGR
jgi:DNA-binding MarR family transcriptional regulator